MGVVSQQSRSTSMTSRDNATLIFDASKRMSTPTLRLSMSLQVRFSSTQHHRMSLCGSREHVNTKDGRTIDYPS